MLSRTNSVKSVKSTDGSALRKTPLSLQDFTFGPKIGKGQFSEVLKAVCVRDGTNVALKRIRIFEMNDAKARHDCLQEINLLQKLNHPNVIKYLGNFVSDENLYIVLELANGGDLSGVLAHYRRVRRIMAERVAWRYCVQLCAALHHMHQQRVMHRDIKPANVFITKTGVVKLGDLGLGRFFSSRTVAAHSLVGTPYYMSPERIREAGYNFKSDIWALGCLLYELAALHSPFYGENMNLYSLCKKIEACDYLPLPSYAYSKQYRNIVKSCIKVEPEDRPDIEYLYEISQEMYKYWARTPVSLNSTPSSSKHYVNDTNSNAEN